MILYAVYAEFFKDGVNAICVERKCRKTPKNEIALKYGLSAFKIWF